MSAGGPDDGGDDADTIDDEATRSFVPASAEARPQPAPFPRIVGDYRILSKIGEGGMGLVFEAEQHHPRRRVAIKVIRGGEFLDDTRVRLFQREADTLARLKHPNIGAIYGSGRTDDGQHFFAMELVRGQTLDAYMASRPPINDRDEIRFRLALARKIVEAVHYAHQRGVIHRDLKPSNIIVTDEYEQSDTRELSSMSRAAPRVPEIKILDFGLARITEGDISQASLVTETGVIKGTLAYMSPEQARGNAGEIDIRSDVYSLGVILYEMLAGVRPYDTSRATLLEALRVICEHEPPPLRRRGSGTTRLHVDLELIVAKALAKEPVCRYGSAAELAADVTRHLTSQPILARPPGTLYQLHKFANRNRALVGGVLATLVVLAAGVVVSTWFAIEATRGRERAEWSSYLGNLAAAEANLRITSPAGAKSRLANCPARLRGWEWSLLSRQADVADIVLAGHDGQVFGVAFSPDGKRVATACRDGLRLFDAASGRLETKLESGTLLYGATFSPDGTQVAAGSGDRTARIWNAESGELIATLTGHTDTVYALAFDSEGRRLVTGSWDTTVRVWDLQTADTLRELIGHGSWVLDVAFNPAGDRVLSSSDDGTARLWSVAEGTAVTTLEGHESTVWGAAFSPDGAQVVTGSDDQTVRLWDVASGETLERWDSIEVAVQSVAFSPTGGVVAAAGQDGSIRLLGAGSGTPLATLSGHEAGVFALAFSPDGTRLVSGALDGTARLWDAAPADIPAQLVGHTGSVDGVAFDRDGRRLASAGGDGTVRMWDVESGELLATLIGNAERFDAVAFTPDGTALAASAGQEVRLWNTARGELSAILTPDEGGTYQVAFNSDGTRIAAGATDGRVSIWDVSNGELSATLAGADGHVGAVAFSRDGSNLLGGSTDSRIRIWDLPSGVVRMTLAGHEEMVNALALSPDGSRLVSGAGDRTVRLWDVVSGRELATLRGHGGPVRTVAFSADGTRVASGGDDRTVRIWDGVGGDLLTTLTGSTAAVGSVAFSPDGKRLAAGSKDRVVRIWDIVRPNDIHRFGAIARAYEQRGEDGAAEPFRRKTVDQLRTSPDADAAQRATALAALGANLVRQQKYAAAEPILLEAQGLLRRPVEDSAWRTARIDSLLGRALAGAGRVEEAAPRLVTGMRALLPTAAPLAVRCDALVAVDAFLAEQGLDEPIERRDQDLYPDDHRLLARLLLDCPGVEDGVVRAASVAAEQLATDPPNAGALREILTVALLHQNRLSDAMRQRIEALSAVADGPSLERSRLAGLEPAFETRAWAVGEGGEKLRKEGRLADATTALTEVLEVQRAFLPPDDWRIGLTASRLGAALADLGRHAEAEPLVLEGVDKLDPAKAHRLQSARVLAYRGDALGQVVRLYEGWGLPERAAEWRAKLEAETR